jgi:hypothetical protein
MQMLQRPFKVKTLKVMLVARSQLNSVVINQEMMLLSAELLVKATAFSVEILVTILLKKPLEVSLDKRVKLLLLGSR